MSDHIRPGGSIGKGYYCLHCGSPGMNCVGEPHLRMGDWGSSRKHYNCDGDRAEVERCEEANRYSPQRKAKRVRASAGKTTSHHIAAALEALGKLHVPLGGEAEDHYQDAIHALQRAQAQCR